MSVSTTQHAILVGYCAGTLEVPTDTGTCPVCGADAGLTPGSYVGHHVEEPGPRAVIVDEDETMTTVEAVNTPVPGLLLCREPGQDGWQVFHAATGLLLHRPTVHFPDGAALRLARRLGTLADWLIDPDTIRDDPYLALATHFVCFVATRELGE